MESTIMENAAEQLLHPFWPFKFRAFGCIVKQCVKHSSEVAVVEQPKRYEWDDRQFVPLTATMIAEMICDAEVQEGLRRGVRFTARERANMMPSRQNIRRFLSEMEEAGLITRVRIENAGAIQALSPLKKALDAGDVTRLRDLSTEETQGASYTAIYLHLQADNSGSIAPEGIATPQVQPEGR